MNPPDENPKTAAGLTKPQLHLVPTIAVQMEAVAFEDGAEKYGPYNWRDKPVTVSTYISAARRHLDAYWEGENLVPDSPRKAHHLAAVRACMAILLDAGAHDCLKDDRPAAKGRFWVCRESGLSDLSEIKASDMRDILVAENRRAAISQSLTETDTITDDEFYQYKPGEIVYVSDGDNRTPEQIRKDHQLKIRLRDERTKKQNMDNARGYHVGE